MSGKSCPKCGAEVAFSTVLFAGSPTCIRCRECKAIMSYGVGVGFLLVPLTICAASLGAAYLAWRASLSQAMAFLAFIGTLFATAFVASFVLTVYFRRNKTLRLAATEVNSNQQK